MKRKSDKLRLLSEREAKMEKKESKLKEIKQKMRNEENRLRGALSLLNKSEREMILDCLMREEVLSDVSWRMKAYDIDCLIRQETGEGFSVLIERGDGSVIGMASSTL